MTMQVEKVLHAILFHYVEDDEECLISSLLSAS